MNSAEHTSGETNRAVKLDFNETRLRKSILRAIVIDDESNYCSNLQSLLGSAGYTADVATSLDRARSLLREHRYSFVLCDNVFGDLRGKQRKGSEFVLEERSLLRGADVVLVTGYPVEQIHNRRLLENEGVTILKKAPGHLKQLEQIASASAEKKVDVVKNSLENLLEDLVESGNLAEATADIRISCHMVSKASDKLKQQLLLLPDQDKNQFSLAGRIFSPRALLLEIEKGSDIAMQLVDMFIDEMLGDSDDFES